MAPRRYPLELTQLMRSLLAKTEVGGAELVDVEGSDCRANVDPPKVERIVENLIANASAHAPGGTRIRIRCWREGDAAVIAVEDEGPGVPAELRDKVFEAFYRGPDAVRRPGSGMGLSLVARLTEMHGGRAWVQDRGGGGASFRVLLPHASV